MPHAPSSHYRANRLPPIGRFLLVPVTLLVLFVAACTDDQEADDAGIDDRPTVQVGSGASDDDDADSAVPPLYLVETAEDDASGEQASLIAQGQAPSAVMDALLEGELALSGVCVGVEAPMGGEFMSVVWPYGYSVGFDDGVVVLLDENDEIIAREGDPISMGGGNVPDGDGEIGEIAPEDCQAEGYWMAGDGVQRLSPTTEPDPAIDNGVTAYFPQWSDEDASQAGSFAGRLVLEDGCLYLDHEGSGEQRLGIWSNEWGIEADGEDVMIIDKEQNELARTGDILSVDAQFGRFDFDEYGIPGKCGSMHVMVFDFEVTGGPDDEMPEAHVQTPEEAREQDAQHYADAFDVSLDEALWRMDMMGRLGNEQQEISENEADRFGGLFWEHEPEFRLVVMMTDGDEEAVRDYFEDPELEEILDVRTVEYTYEELLATQNEVMDLLHELGLRVSGGTSVQENRVEIFAGDKAIVEDALKEAGEELPENVVIIDEAEVETLDD